jgi:hypothetical protein
MSILCELFIAEPADAPLYEELCDDEAEGGRFERVLLGGMNSLQFEPLLGIMEREVRMASIPYRRPSGPEVHRLEQVGEPEKTDTSWFFRFPTGFVAWLAALDAPRAAAVTEQWARTEELSTSPEDIEHVVSSLMELARLAVASNRGLYMWGSL